MLAQRAQTRKIGQKIIPAQCVAQQRGQLGIAHPQPAPGRDAVGHVLQSIGIGAVPVGKHALLENMGVQLSHAVGAVRAGDGQVGHVDAVVFNNAEALVPLRAQALVQAADDGNQFGRDGAHQAFAPAFQGLGHHGMVGKGEGAEGDLRRLLKVHALAGQDANELRHGHGGMGVVELHSKLLGKALALGTLTQQILHRGAAQQILLAQAQRFARALAVARIEQGGNIRRAHRLTGGLFIVLVVKGGHVDGLHRLGLPKAQRADDPAQADHRHIIGHGAHGEIGKAHDHAFILAAHRPGIAMLGPIVGRFHLPSILKGLLEQAEAIVQAIAAQGDILRGGGVQIARSQAAQATVAQRRILDILHIAQVRALLIEQLFYLVVHAQAAQVIVPQATHQIFRADIAGAAALAKILLILRPLGGDGEHHSLSNGVVQLEIMRVGKVHMIARAQEALGVADNLLRGYGIGVGHNFHSL